ncbi:PREDICTED: twinkle protein, mitochondrial isoform X2 [Nicrophorus vespilloides]|nr:PREDICTED: twinkle protein, mitochondrial isoform X2 [Nicrophorus vespilloides]
MDMSQYISAKKGNVKIGKDPMVEEELEHLSQYLKSKKRNTTSFMDLNDEDFNLILEKFELPECASKELMHSLGVTVDLSKMHIYFPLKNSALEVVSYKVLKERDDYDIKPKLLYTKQSGVLISNNAKSKSAVIVANISDFLILAQSGVSSTVICLPNELASLSQHILPCFERFNKLILWFQSDLATWENARNFARKFVEKRCLFIKHADRNKLPHLDPQQNFNSTISGAQPMWHKSITTFASLRQEVLTDLMNVDRVQGIKWNRFPTLNKILKGHRRGELSIFTGPTGSGKTTFISEYSLDLAMQGINTLWGSFEIRNARLARTMLQQMSGIALDENLDKYDFWADKFEQLPIYYMTFHGQQSIKVVMEAIEHAVYVHDISHVIIDNLQFMMGTSEDSRHMDRFWKQDLIVANFRSFATRRNCHVTLVIHPRKEREDEDLTTSSIFGGAKASQEADNILIIQDKRLASIKGKKYLQICKNRYSGDLGIVPLEFDKTSLSFAPKKKKSDDKRLKQQEGSE